MRTLTAAVIVTTLMASSAFAAPRAVAPLPAGQPAGVKEAQLTGSALFWLMGLGVVAGGIALSVTPNNNVITSTTTSATGTP